MTGSDIMRKTILTGLRPTGNLHLGHLFGAGQNYVRLQDDYEFYLEIADVQALTDNFDNPEKVRKNVYEITKDLLAIGLNPEKVNFFIQSKIPEIAELTVYYSNLVTVARLQRNPTVKTEISQKKELFGNSGESITYGFLGYPVSQAADITAFDGEVVPVGDDQLPLLEQCREIVRKFNSIYGDTLKEPEAVLSKNTRIKGLDGNEKMGKSLGNAVYLVDDEETIKKKVMGAVTDPEKIKKDDPANPDVCMVFYYHKLVNNEDNILPQAHVQPAFSGRLAPHSVQNLPVTTAPQAHIQPSAAGAAEGAGADAGWGCIANRFCAFAPPAFMAIPMPIKPVIAPAWLPAAVLIASACAPTSVAAAILVSRKTALFCRFLIISASSSGRVTEPSATLTTRRPRNSFHLAESASFMAASSSVV